MPTTTSSDGVALHHTSRGDGRPLVLLHGWNTSGRFFDRAVDALARDARVVTIDLRGHGASADPGRDVRIARMAADLREVLADLDLHDATVLGWSMGCAVVWSHLELFGPGRIARAVYAQQSPRQYAAPDWTHHHAEIVDDAALARFNDQVAADPRAHDREQLDMLAATPLTDDERELFLAEMARCPVPVRTSSMTDNTRQDWRDLLPTLDLPTLVLAATQDPTFDADGVRWVAEQVPGARSVDFEHSSHGLVLDEPELFAASVGEFHTDG